MPHIKFQKRAIELLPPAPAGQRIEYTDPATPGLRLRVTDKGVKSWAVLARVKGGDLERITLDKYADLTPMQAIDEAAKVRGKQRAGQSVRDQRDAMTFGQLFADFMERHAKINLRSWREYQRLYDSFIEKPLGKRKLVTIDRARIARVHSGSSDTPTQANRVVATISATYGWGIKAGLVASNPAQGIAKNLENQRKRYLRGDEPKRFFETLVRLEDTPRDVFTVALLTGARRNNVLSMTWADVDLDGAQWRLSGVKMKNGEPITIHLAPAAVALLRRRKSKVGAGAVHVFPSNSKAGHYMEPKRAWNRLLEVSGLTDLRLHDLRHTLGAWLVSSGASTAINARALGHKTMSAAARYQHADVDPVRDAMNKATSALLVSAGIQKAAEVVPLKGKRRA